MQREASIMPPEAAQMSYEPIELTEDEAKLVAHALISANWPGGVCHIVADLLVRLPGVERPS